MSDNDIPARNVAVVLYDGFELLDVFGPVEILSVLPEHFQITMVSAESGLIASSQGTRVETTHSLSGPEADIVLVPGGIGWLTMVEDTDFLDQLRAYASGAKLVTSVCTGSAILAAAGLLDGYRATSNKRSFDHVAQYGKSVSWQRRARWVHDRDRWTSSGVSAGIDMTAALIGDLVGEELAQHAARVIEFEPHTDPHNDAFAD
ncbi:DJ-1/PfpI family protein [Gordonia sp. NPDC127522]|uniref:DJ-1/PfpI family protein n=1 Tax=Gordonia sp. NPDC127522 TaxID=3345390 RepID=UPI003641FBD6